MTDIPLDPQKTENFENKMVDILNLSSAGMMISIGHRTGLFDIMAEMEAADSDQIAQKANLNERYVREWLGAMVTTGVVEYHHTDKTYTLPPEHACRLTRAASPNNLSVYTQYISVFGLHPVS